MFHQGVSIVGRFPLRSSVTEIGPVCPQMDRCFRARIQFSVLCRKTFPGVVRRTADPSASARDDKGEGGASVESGCGSEGVFVTLGGPQGHDNSVEKHFQEWSAELQIPRLRSG
jgi:hypothetical protein